MELSLLITSPTELRRLGVEGLKLTSSTVQEALTNNPGDIEAAAHDVLSLWRKQYEDQVEAFNDLSAALIKCGMNKQAAQLLAHQHRPLSASHRGK